MLELITPSGAYTKHGAVVHEIAILMHVLDESWKLQGSVGSLRAVIHSEIVRRQRSLEIDDGSC